MPLISPLMSVPQTNKQTNKLGLQIWIVSQSVTSANVLRRSSPWHSQAQFTNYAKKIWMH